VQWILASRTSILLGYAQGGTSMGCAQTAVARCSECDRLWKDCCDALEEYLKIIAERNAARKREDHDLVEAFAGIESDSLEKCKNAQRAIFDHKAKHNLDLAGTDCKANSPDGVLATELLA
jgi:hypothetical protein